MNRTWMIVGGLTLSCLGSAPVAGQTQAVQPVVAFPAGSPGCPQSLFPDAGKARTSWCVKLGKEEEMRPNALEVCAKEGAVCKVKGPATVIYGAVLPNESFVGVAIQATSPVTCDNQAFTDPAQGTPKQCFVSLPASPAPSFSAAAMAKAQQQFRDRVNSLVVQEAAATNHKADPQAGPPDPGEEKQPPEK